MSRIRRTWAAQEKANIVLEILREESTLEEISRKYDVAQPVLSRWKADFISNMSLVFDKNGEDIEKIKKEYVDTYNYHRGHQSYNYQTPAEIYFGDAANAV